jgi:hypothetical protein
MMHAQPCGAAVCPQRPRSLKHPLLPIVLKPKQGWFAIDLLATFPADYVVRAVQGTWVCSLRGSCLWSATAIADGVSAISLLRVVRIFRWARWAGRLVAASVSAQRWLAHAWLRTPT